MNSKLAAIIGSYILIIVMVATVMIPILDGMSAQLVEVRQNADQNYVMGIGENTIVDIEVIGRSAIDINGYRPRILLYGEVISLAMGGGFIISGHPQSDSGEFWIATYLADAHEVVYSKKIHIESGVMALDPETESERTVSITGEFFYAAPDGDWVEIKAGGSASASDISEVQTAPCIDNGKTGYIVQAYLYNNGSYWGAWTYTDGDMETVVPVANVTSGGDYTVYGEDEVRYHLDIEDNGTYSRFAIMGGINVLDGDTWTRIDGGLGYRQFPRYIVPNEYHIEETRFGPVMTLIHITPILILMLMIVHLGYEMRKDRIESYWN